jgi:long-chain acyl-CoA synthetase|tara:strand:+ start:908 stop:2752 length:1845 start_codon:yes stop_codon:yes gene_type:complete
MNVELRTLNFEKYNTIPKLFWYHVQYNGDNISIWWKHHGVWEPITWRQYGDWSRDVANGLLASGLNPGDMVSILSETRAEWVVADMAIIGIGCVTAPIYHSNTEEQVKYIVEHSDSRLVFAEDQEQLDKILEIWDDLPLVKKIVVMDKYHPGNLPNVTSLEDFCEMGRQYGEEHSGEFEERMASVNPEDVISFIYTSGTTGPPKATMINSRNVIAIIRHLPEIIEIEENDMTIAYLPLAHVAERDVGHFMKLVSGNQTVFAESLDDLPHNLRQTGPTVMFGTPRVFEKFYARIATGIDDATWLQKKVYTWAVDVGKRVSARQIEKQPLSFLLRIKNTVARFLIFQKIYDIFGGNIRFMLSGGAPISPEIIRYFHWLGLIIYEVYGMTETTGLVSANKPGQYKIGSVGPIYPDTEVRIAPDGEICTKGPQMCLGYYKDEEATRELLKPDGNGGYWLHTGDIGYLDDEGYLYITDRKKDLIITAGGKNIAPQNIENLMKMNPYISQAMVYGDRRPYLTALITLDEDEITKFARDRKLLYQDLADLSKKKEVTDLISHVVHEKNSELASYETIKKFRVLEEDFDQDKDEITPTLKVKRKVVISRYKHLIEEMYGAKR